MLQSEHISEARRGRLVYPTQVDDPKGREPPRGREASGLLLDLTIDESECQTQGE
jgi:hypothetical protein